MDGEGEESDSDFSYGGGGGKREQKKKKSKAKPEQIPKLSKWDEKFPTDLPEGTKTTDFDWSDSNIEGVIREVMDQGNRRTCWTSASTRSFSARLVIEKRFDPPVSLSALHLLVGLINEVDSSGGLSKLSRMRKFMIDHGTVLEEDCKCTQLALEEKNNKSKPNPVVCTGKGKSERVRVFKVKDFVILEQVDEKELIRLVIKGPVAVTMDVYEDFLDFKGDGIYTGFTSVGRLIDKHLILVKGFGTQMHDGTHYWKVQNTAGRKWGNEGCGKIIREISRGGAPSLFTGVLYPKLLDHYEGQKVGV